MEYVKGIPLKFLVKLVCKKCLANVSGIVLKQMPTLELCETCKNKCLEFKKVKGLTA